MEDTTDLREGETVRERDMDRERRRGRKGLTSAWGLTR
jgi:hypothetical protein